MDKIDVWRGRSRIGLVLFYGIAGMLHITIPRPFLGIMPSWVSAPADVVLLTGVCEISGAAGLLMPRFRKCAGIGLALYAICVYPANLKHAVDALDGTSISSWQWIYHVVRLPLQPIIVWLALFTANVVNWPLRSVRR